MLFSLAMGNEDSICDMLSCSQDQASASKWISIPADSWTVWCKLEAMHIHFRALDVVHMQPRLNTCSGSIKAKTHTHLAGLSGVVPDGSLTRNVRTEGQHLQVEAFLHEGSHGA